MIADLTTEMNDQTYHVEAVKSILNDSKNEFFTHVTSDYSVIVDSLMQHCVLPRVLLSPVDAIYCTQYAILLVNLEVSQMIFRRIICYDMISYDMIDQSMK